MKTEDCPVYQLIKEKVESTHGSRRLTKADRVKIDRELKNCPFNCDNPKECDRLNNIISDFTPPESRGSDHANARSWGKDMRPSPYELPQLHAVVSARIPLRM